MTEVGDRILEAVAEQDPRGYGALLAISVPFKRDMLQESFQQLMEEEAASPSTLVRLARTVNASFVAALVAQIVAAGSVVYYFFILKLSVGLSLLCGSGHLCF